ncbi:NF-kappa-B inhibitor-interacting Ras-like protein 1 isoform 3-T4 [Mantella aurantiaca]
MMGKGSRVVICGLAKVGKTAILEQGLQDGMELPKHYFSIADGFILVYSVDSLQSFQRVEQLKRDLDRFRDKKEVVTIVLGNKADLEDYRQVDTEMALQWARAEKVKLWEVSVANRKTLLEPFTLLASKLNQIQSKSAFPLPGRKTWFPNWLSCCMSCWFRRDVIL